MNRRFNRSLKTLRSTEYGQGLMRSIDLLLIDLDQPAPIVQSPNVAEINQQQLEVEVKAEEQKLEIEEIKKIDPQSPSPKTPATRSKSRGLDLGH